MRILHLVKTSVGALWAARQIAVLVENGLEIDVVLPDAGPNLEAFTTAGATPHFLNVDLAGLRNPAAFLRARKSLRALVNLRKPDLIHSHFVGSTMFSRLALGRNHPVPRIFQVPGPLHLENPITRLAEIQTAGPADYWVGSCRLTTQIYKQAGIAERRIGLSYYGTAELSCVPNDPRPLREALGLMGSPRRIIGMVAFAYPPKRWLGQKRGLKGHEDLIDAARILVDRGEDIQLVFIGGVWGKAASYYEAIRDYGSRQLGDRLTFLGSRTDVPLLYPGMDVAVHPSHSENVGGAAESLMMGVPTVTSDVGGFPDVVIPGETGWTVPAKSSADLADAIGEALADPVQAKEKAGRGQQLVRHLFDVKRTGREIAGFYEHVIRDNEQTASRKRG